VGGLGFVPANRCGHRHCRDQELDRIPPAVAWAERHGIKCPPSGIVYLWTLCMSERSLPSVTSRRTPREASWPRRAVAAIMGGERPDPITDRERANRRDRTSAVDTL
jgi:hypothetical protein